MQSIKGSKSELFEGRRDALIINIWTYQVGKYLKLVLIDILQLLLDKSEKILFASTLLRGIAANGWYMLVQSEKAVVNWKAFIKAARREIVPQDGDKRSGDKLRALVQKSDVSSYVNEFRNIVSAISNISRNEERGNFCAASRPMIRL